MPSAISWKQVKQSGNIPNPIAGHTIVTIGKFHYMFGGLEKPQNTTDPSKLLPKNDLYALKIGNNNTVQWTLKQCLGDIPMPRAYHSACKVGQDRIFIFGGCYTSNLRYNDTFYLKLPQFQWNQPSNQKSSGIPKNAMSKIGGPQPRAYHSMTPYKNRIIIFGGHGGVDYNRTAFNDIYELDLETFQWRKPKIKGNPPQPRGGHVASLLANKDKMFIFGGWNFVLQFNNLFIYDIQGEAWIDPQITHQIPKWNLNGCLAPSIPSWKYFIFGGSCGNFFEGSNRTSSKYVSDTWYYDIDFEKWVPVKLQQNQDIAPQARQSPSTFYNYQEQKFYVFGGWANDWLNDMWVLPVGSITGPPYAITHIKPTVGPLTGKTKLSIFGAGFKQSYSSIIVRFFGGKSPIDAQGIFKQQNLIECQTPNFEHFGPRKCQIRISCGKYDFTITSAQFTYYLNTRADQTICFGPGLLQENFVQSQAMFIIQSRNAQGANRTTGSDQFKIQIKRLDLKVPEDPVLDQREQKKFDNLPEEDRKNILQKRQRQKQNMINRINILPKIIDQEDGTYLVKYKVPQQCKCQINISFLNDGKQQPIRGSKFVSSFVNKGNPKTTNQFDGTIMQNYLHHQITQITKFLQTTKQNIQIRNKPIADDVNQLLKVMASLKNLQDRKDQIVLTLDRIQEVLKTYQKKYDKKRQGQTKKIHKLMEDTKTVSLVATRVEKQITGPKTVQAGRTKQKIKKFQQQLKQFQNNLKKQSIYFYQTGPINSFQKIQQITKNIQKLKKQLHQFQYYQDMFKFQDRQSNGCQKIIQNIQCQVTWMNKLWQHIKKCQDQFDLYLKLTWDQLDLNQMEDTVKRMRQALQPIKIADKKCNTFTGISQQIKKWAIFIPEISDLKHQSMITQDKRHWNKVRQVVNRQFQVDKNLSLNLLWQLRLYSYKQQIDEFTQIAKNQAKMEKQIAGIREFWKVVEFELVPLKNSNVSTLKMLDQHFQILQGHQLSINTMLLSKFVAFFQTQFQKWKQNLGSVYDVVQLLSQVQKTWSFLQNLFIHSQQVKKQLPQVSKQFVSIDKQMRDIMAKGAQVRNIMKFCTIQGMYKRLDKIQGQLKICQKALNQYLDSKRKAFPRFYFVSVNDLLDILSNGNSPAKVNKHMPKIFQAIDTLDLKQGGQRPTAIGMKSGVGFQYVKLTNQLQLNGKVQVYLQDMVNSMVSTLRDIATKSFSNYQKMNRKQWMQIDPAQITLLVNNIMTSSQVQQCFKKISDGSNVNALKDFYKHSVQRLTQLIKMVQGHLQKDMRQKIMCIITMDTHSRDIIQKLDNQNVKKADAFQWQSQLKFYWADHGNFKDSVIKIADASFWYSYQYLGNGPRLVITPLTDRIYVTATQALHLKMGCAPAGPAGTGKTQTTKDLSNGLAKACYVFNCSSQMNYQSMGNIYKGLASSGCWGCFDEFNRLLPQVLSVCSVQFKSVTDAIKQNKKRFILQGDQISLDKTCGVFITMNPGYLGRAQLPQGLKALFRPITVVVPDLQLICQNMLMAQGFVDAKMLAKKFVTLYMLCKDLLSKQLHYDWGLRAIKSVLVVAGVFKRNQPTVSQSALLMRALRDFNLPKIAFADLDIFFGLLGDLFPKIQIKRKRDMEFQNVIEQCVKDSQLYPDQNFILKVVQLKQLLEIRHCVFAMGPPGAGKTSTWKLLGKAQDKVGKKTTIVDINPKTVSTRDLYGYNLPTKQWKDGLLSKTMRSLSQLPDSNPKWILLDGDLDANWIESMNSVMDDNKILTLANNQRIPLKAHMRMIFEIRDLRFASPATVSRAGILYISDDSGYQWQAYIQSWLQKLPKIQSLQSAAKKKDDLKMLFNKYCKGTLFYIKKSCKLLVPVSPISMIASLCSILQIILRDQFSNIQFAFVFAIIWCCGGCLSEKDSFDYRKQFSNWWKSQWKTAAKFPSKGTIFDYYVNSPKNPQGGVQPCKFAQWTQTLQPVDFDSGRGDVMGNITVPTKQTLATQYFIKKFIFVNHPVLMIGLAGCGKTQLAKGILRNIVKDMPENYNYQLINFSYYTDSSYLQIQLQQFLKKIAGKQFGPPGKQKLIYFIDDLNMPQLDQYDTQSAISLLRQHADYEHWYDVSKLSLKDIVNTQTLAALNPSAGSFFVDPRYMRHFWTVSIPFPDNQSLFQIYSTFLTGHLKRFKPTVQELAPLIIRSALTLHQNVISSFRKTAINFHYQFNLRHISNIFQGLLLSDASKLQQPQKMVKLWVHQSQRTYGDRLVSSDHLIKYNALMFQLLKKSFSRYSLNRYFTNNPQNLIFCNFATGMNGQDRLYDQIPNQKLLPFIQQGLGSYNDNNPVMNLVLFQDAMKHVCRITRIVMPSSGHGLLVGVGGSGKQSLSKLAAWMMLMSTFQITISSTYSLNDLRTDLQSLYQKTGIKQDDILFLFTQGQITNQRFLVYINDLLASGQIAQLYTSDQKQQIINNVRPKVKSQGKIDSRDNTNCWNWYIDRVKQKLHMSICFSPVGQSLRRRARQFPALVNNTIIDWFFPWPKDALFNVATKFLQEENLGEEAVRKAVVTFMPSSFQVVNKLSTKLYTQQKRYVYTTPKSFLQLIKLFKSMLNQKRNDLLKKRERYQSGLIKLKQTAQQVAIIQQQVKVKGIQAQIKKQQADKFAAKVKIQKQKVQVENSKAEIQAAKCAVIKKDVQHKKQVTQEKLQSSKPLVKQAQQVLSSIKKKDFDIAKSFASPPAGVPEVFSATIWLLSTFYKQIQYDKNSKKPKDWAWKSGQRLMKDPNAFKQTLLAFKQIVFNGQVPHGNVAFVKKQYLSNPQFDPQIIQNKSRAAAGLCAWVINIVKYYDVIQQVIPLRKQLSQANQQLQVATQKLTQVQQIVRKLNAQLAQLNKQYQQAQNQKQAAINQAQRCARRLNLAQRLVKALGSQNQRWAKSIVLLDQQIKVIVGDVLMSSAFVSYAGPFNKKFRDMMIKDQFEKYFKNNKITMSPLMDPVKLLTDQSTAAKWNKQTLPSDKVSIENGTILTNSQRYPLIIDPQLQGISWIRQKQKQNKLKSLRLGSKTINRQLQIAIQNGHSALIQNMGDSIDAILMPIIARSFIIKGKSKILKFAGKDLTLDKNFKLFLQTKLSNPHYPPQIQAQSTLINFTVTQDGLGDQLLYLIVQRQRPDLAARKLQLITQQNDFKIRLNQLQTQLLYKLANAKGDILDDIALIQNLQDSKRISVQISQKVQIAKVTQAKINQTSQKYRPAAIRGALIYFLLSDLPKIHSFYKYSLQSFIDVINRAIDKITQGVQIKAKMFQIDGEGKAIIPQQKKRVNKKNKKASSPQKIQSPTKQPQKKKQQPKPPHSQQKQQQQNAQNPNKQQIKKQQQPHDQKKQKQKQPQPQPQPQQQQELLSPRSLEKRIEKLINSISYTAFNFTRRGLFEKHKTIVSSLLTFRVLQRDDKLSSQQIDHLVIGKSDPNPPPMPQPLKGFLTDQIWANIKGLQIIPIFSTLGNNVQQEYLVWKKWYQEERVQEVGELPKSLKQITKFQKLLLYRAMRPDRVSSALNSYVSEIMGEEYVQQPPFNIFQTFDETDKKIPIFFVLFPGVDPTPQVQRVAAKYNITIANKKFTNISMGQGQQKPAKQALFNAAQKGYWIMLQNLHLMQTWLKGLNGLQGFLQQCFSNCHPNFRVFLSSQPPPLPQLQIIPQSILQSSIKVSNQAPQYLKANLRRAYANFDQKFLQKCDRKPNQFKSCLFTLCYFHSLVTGRKKFGSQGWSRIYNFNDGDLTICADVLYNYLSKYDIVPWDDLKYIFGQIMYGGHITDDWDRRTNATYLKVLFKPELLLPNFNLLYHLFKSPDPAKLDYQGYRKYIEEKLPAEVPQMFGMHPNAQIGYLTEQCLTIFDTILSIQGGKGGGAGSVDESIMTLIVDLKTRTPIQYSMLDINGRVKQKTPYVVVCLQQCQRMNTLLQQIKKTLEDLRLGLTGALNITDAMENLQRSLSFNKVPSSWQTYAYPSRKNLSMWFNQLIQRCNQLEHWSSTLVTPKSLLISHLFNPMSFLTAIMQNTARQKILPLDNMALQTNVTLFKGPQQVANTAQNGAYVHGFVLQGAAWQLGAPGQQGYLIQQKPKQLHPKLPVVNIVSVLLKDKRVLGQYDCPVYYTTQRGPTYIFRANMNMESQDSDPNKWILSGTCLLLSDD